MGSWLTNIETRTYSEQAKMLRTVLISCLLISLVSSFPQRSVSYLAPVEEEDASASEIIPSYGSPQADVLAEASEVVSLYSSPREEVIFSPSEVVNDYSSPQGEVISSSDSVIDDFAEPEIIFAPSQVTNDYSFPKSAVITSPSEVFNDYASPRSEVISAPNTRVNTYSSAASYGSVQGNSLSSYSVDRDTASSNLATVAVRAEPIAIVRSDYDNDNEGNYHYAYETANGIKQEVTGEMKVIDDAQVYVMRGSYSYPGADGLDYVVDWYADETGYHPTAPHLPKSVEPITNEVREAVAAQLRFAAEEDAAAAASANNVVYAAPDNILGGESAFDDVYATADDNLAGYGEEAAATQLLDSYSLPRYN